MVSFLIYFVDNYCNVELHYKDIVEVVGIFCLMLKNINYFCRIYYKTTCWNDK